MNSPPSSWTFELAPIWVGGKRLGAGLSLNARPHWAVKKRVNDAWYAYVRAMCVNHRIPQLARASIFIEMHRVRAPDRDNRFGQCKCILDGIVKAGVLPDDSDAYLVAYEIAPVKVKSMADEKLVVTISAGSS